MIPLLKIEGIKLSRSLGTFLLSIGMPLVFFLIFSSTVQLDDPVAQKAFVQSYMLTMTAFSMSGFALFTFPMMLSEDRKNNWLSFIEHSPLSQPRYYLSKLFRVYLCFICSIMAVFLVGALVREVSMTGERWLVSAILLLITSLMYLALGLLLSLFKSEQTMSVVANLTYFVLAIMGGSWMPISLFPDWVQEICRLTPGYHANHLVVTYAEKHDFIWKSLFIVLTYAIIFLGTAMVIQKRSEVK